MAAVSLGGPIQSASLSKQENLTPSVQAIYRFFEEVCEESPEESMQGRNKVFTIKDPSLSAQIDSYGNLHLNFAKIDSEKRHVADVQSSLEKLVEVLCEKQEFNSIWLNVDQPYDFHELLSIVPKGFIIGSPQEGNLILDLQKNQTRIWQWLKPRQECQIPPGATHNLGSCALAVDTAAQKILLVVNVRRSDSWNVPGGSFDVVKDQDVIDTAIRELTEETGFEARDPQSFRQTAVLVGYSHYPKNQFARAMNTTWAFYGENISEQELRPTDPNEIKLVRWISFEDLQNSQGWVSFQNAEGQEEKYKVGLEITSAFNAAIQNQGLRLIHEQGWRQIFGT